MNTKILFGLVLGILLVVPLVQATTVTLNPDASTHKAYWRTDSVVSLCTYVAIGDTPTSQEYTNMGTDDSTYWQEKQINFYPNPTQHSVSKRFTFNLTAEGISASDITNITYIYNGYRATTGTAGSRKIKYYNGSWMDDQDLQTSDTNHIKTFTSDFATLVNSGMFEFAMCSVSLLDNGESVEIDTDYVELIVHYTAPTINVTLNSPTNASTNTSNQITFSYIPEGESLANCSLWTNVTGSWVINQTNATAITSAANNTLSTSLPDGNYLWNTRCYNSTGSFNDSAVNWTLYVQAPPTVTTDSPTNTTYGTDYVWVNATINEAGWCNYSVDSGTFANMSNDSATHWYINKTSLSDGNHNVTFKCNDTNGYVNSSVSETYFTTDTTPPTYENNQSSAPSSYSTTTYTYFNITWNDTYSAIDTVYIEINCSNSTGDIFHTNYTATNTTYSDGFYNYSQILPACNGTWRSYANDTENNWNATSRWFFNITKATPTLTLTGSNVTYSTNVSIVASEANTNDGGCVYQFFKNNTNTQNGSSLSDASKYGAQHYKFTYNTTGCGNYTSTTKDLIIIVSKGTPTVTAYINSSNSDASYPTGDDINLTGLSTATIYNVTVYLMLNATGYGDNYTSDWNHTENITSGLAAAKYNFTAIFYGDANWSTASDELVLTITSSGKPAYSGLATKQTSPVEYNPSVEHQFNATWVDADGLSDVVFEWNGATNYTYLLGQVSNATTEFYVNVTYGVSNYTYKWYCNDTTNNLTKTSSYQYNISQNATNPINVKFEHGATNYTNSNISTTSDVTLRVVTALNYSNSGTLNTFLDGNSISIPYTNTLGVGIHDVMVNTSGNINYTSAQKVYTITITASTPSGSEEGGGGGGGGEPRCGDGVCQGVYGENELNCPTDCFALLDGEKISLQVNQQSIGTWMTINNNYTIENFWLLNPNPQVIPVKVTVECLGEDESCNWITFNDNGTLVKEFTLVLKAGTKTKPTMHQIIIDVKIPPDASYEYHRANLVFSVLGTDYILVSAIEHKTLGSIPLFGALIEWLLGFWNWKIIGFVNPLVMGEASLTQGGGGIVIDGLYGWFFVLVFIIFIIIYILWRTLFYGS